MIVVAANPNVVRVGMIRAGCFKTEFNSTYLTRLNGIISQNEFRESIGNINSKISYQKSKMFFLVFVGLCLIGGFSLIIIGGVVSTRSRQYNSIIFIGTGAGLLGFTPTFFVIGWCVIRMRRTTQMRKAISEESKKYSTRSPTSCTWRLNVGRIWTGYRRHHHILYFYHVIITIHHTVASNRSANVPDNIPPPPYPGQTSTYCSQCGHFKQDLTANFCSSCGHPFNKF